MMSDTLAKIEENRLMRMREGQNAGELVQLPSDPEIRMILVPLTDGEWLHSLKMADQVMAGDNEAGLMVRDRVQKQCVLMYAARETSDFTKRIFNTIEDIEKLEGLDVDLLYDEYMGMVASISPSLYMMTPEEFDSLKAVWQRIEWNELSGMQQYAAVRFLRSIHVGLLQDNSFGSPSTLKSTLKTDEPTHVFPAEHVKMDENRVEQSA